MKTSIETAANGLFETTFSLIPHPMVLMDEAFDILEANASFLEVFEVTAEDIKSKNFLKLVHIEEGEEVRFRQFLDTNAKGNRVYRFKAFVHTGPETGILTNIENRFFQFQGRTFCLSELNHITSRKREEDTLETSAEILRSSFDNTSYLVQSVGPDGSILYANQKWLNVLGYSKEDLPNLNITDIISDDQVPHVFKLLSRIKEGEKIELVECVFKTKGGREISVEGNVDGYFEQGKFVFTMGVFRDITKRKMVEETYSLMVHSIPVPIFIIQSGTFRLVNPAFCALIEYQESELIGMEATNLAYAEDGERLRKNFLRLEKSNRQVSFEFRLIRKSGEVRWVIATVISILYEEGRAFLGSIVDLTESKLVEEALKESQKRYQTLFNSAGDAIFIHDMKGRFLEVNDAACSMLGYSRSEFLKLNFSTVESPHFHNLVKGRIKELLAKGSLSAESENITRDGKTIPVEIHSRIIEYDKKQAILHIAHDITDRKQNEISKKRRAARLESLVRISEFKADRSQDMLDYALEEVIKATDSRLGLIYFYNENNREFTLCSFSKEVLKLSANKIRQSMCRLDTTGLLGEAIRQRKPIILNSPQNPSLLKNGYPEGRYQIENYIAVPIFRGQEIVAEVVTSNKDVDYLQADIQHITALMDPIWDIRERWKAEEALRESEKRYRQLVELSQDGILQMDLKGNIVAANAAGSKMFGYPDSGMLGLDFAETYLPEERVVAYERLRQIKFNNPMRFERQAVRADGTIFYIDVSISPLTQGYFQEVIRDITERKKAEEQVQYQAMLVDNVSDAIISTTLDAHILSWNKAAERIYGWKQEEVLGKRIDDVLRRLTGEKMQGLLKQLDESGFWEGDTAHKRRDGSSLNISSSLCRIKDSSGKSIGTVGIFRDITERNKLEKELQGSMQKYQQLVENLTDFVVETNLKGEYLFVNLAYCKLVGKEQGELLGKSAMTFIHEEDANRAEKNMENLYNPPYTAYLEHRVLTPNGYRWVAWKTKAILGDNGNISALTAVGRDITESKEAKDELEKANQRLIELDKLKDNFLSTVSHELRTPLTSIKSFVEILLNYDEDRATQKEFLGIINEESDRLTRLINDFLDLSKIQAGKMQWKNQDISLAEVVNSAANAVRPLIEKEKLTLSINIEADLPHIVSDKDRMIQVVTNILGNSIKFTPKGGSITIKAWSNDSNAPENPNTVNVSIKDTGIGISPEHHNKIFENFGQVGDVLKDKPKGTGLGLPICKKIVENFGGKIWVESEIGKGTTFLFSLPITKPGNTPAPAPTALPTVNSIISSKTILVVDDETNIRRFIQHELSARGHKVIEASGGIEAVDMAKRYHPDLITLDVAMPDLSGYDVTTVLKNDPDTQSIPILIVSVIEDARKAYRVGANDYITKPFDINTLMTRITRLLQGKKKNILIVDDDSAFVISLELELRKCGCITDKAENGKKALIKIEEKKPDLILLDIKMPETDGFEVIKALKNKPESVNIPIIMMTGFEIDDSRVKALTLGADDYVNKSEGFNRLFESIERTNKVEAKNSH